MSTEVTAPVEATATPAVPAAPPVAATPAPETPAAPPRDEHGRFTKANIDKAMGVTAPPPAAAATPAAPVEPAKFAGTPEAPPVDDLAALDAQLAQIPDDTGPAPTAAPIAPPQQQGLPAIEVQQVQQWAQNPQMAAEAVDAVRTYMTIKQAADTGNLQGLLGAFHPNLVEALAEHIYQTRKEQFAQRLVDEQNGVAHVNPKLTQMEQQLQAMQQRIEQQEREKLQRQRERQQQQQTAALQTKFNAYMDSLFDAVKLKESPNRVFLESAIKNEVFKNPQALANVRAGRFGDVKLAFRQLYPQFRAQFSPASTAPHPGAATPTGSSQLMAAAAGTSTVPQEDTKLSTSDGRINPKAWGSRLKQMLKAV